MNNELIKNKRCLQLLSRQFKSIQEASTEIINLQAIINLPKGTEHFLSDIHGEYEAFSHVLKNASGVIRRKIENIFGCSLRQSEKRSLATLIYYPEEVLEKVITTEQDLDDWYEIILHRLVLVCREVSSKYSRSKVRKALPKDFSYILEELLHEQEDDINKQQYYDEIIKTIIKIKRAKYFIVALCELIQRLAVDKLHIIGDIYDRGPGAHLIMDTLYDYHSVDIQWGNHDIIWMGAASGSEVCMVNTIRICARYCNLSTLEDGYGINLMPLITFAMETYKDDPCDLFEVKEENIYNEKEVEILKKLHKAIVIIQFKLEGRVINRNPEFNMDDRLVLNNINYEKQEIIIDGKTYKIRDNNFPTIDIKNPYKLTKDETEVVDKLKISFLNNEKLQKHVDFLFTKGSMYLKYNGNLLYHGCIPMEDDGTFAKKTIKGRIYKGRMLTDKLEAIIRDAYANRTVPNCLNLNKDYFWYLWSGEKSPLFGKKKMATFERYFINEKETHYEEKNAYYKYRDQLTICNKILKEFGCKPESGHIINGHVPVEVIKGESPIKADGKLFVIDGGLSKAYQAVTGIAGYTLIYNSYGMLMAAHEAFESTQKAIEEEIDIASSITVVETNSVRIRVGDTDIGEKLKEDIEELMMLLEGYRKVMIKSD